VENAAYKSARRRIVVAAVWLAQQGSRPSQARAIGAKSKSALEIDTAMTHERASEEHLARQITSRLHPRVYASLICLALWFALSVWSFAGVGVTDYLLVIVNGFIFIAAVLLFLLSRVGRADDVRKSEDGPFRAWASGDFDIWQGRLTGMEAMGQILLPLAAAAVGMMAFGIVFHLVELGRT
jgi:hypothetical protein